MSSVVPDLELSLSNFRQKIFRARFFSSPLDIADFQQLSGHMVGVAAGEENKGRGDCVG